jgi:hypothetical protein
LNLGDTFATGSSHGRSPKNLLGMPWRVALALQDDGWLLRADIILAKRNPVPNAVKDRPTISHEYLFLLSKGPSYFYDLDAVREPHAEGKTQRSGAIIGRNRRSVWHVTMKPYEGAHFAVWPPEIPEQCIRAGTSERGACPRCGSPWVRAVEEGPLVASRARGGSPHENTYRDRYKKQKGASANGDAGSGFGAYVRRDLGFRPACDCPQRAPVPGVVLDPFAGSGTTLEAARRLGRSFVGIEINKTYRSLIEDRLRGVEGA